MPPEETQAEKKSPPWHSLDVQDVLSRLNVQTKQGLNADEAIRRIQQYGQNVFETAGTVPWYKVLLRQFMDVLIIILLVAAGVSIAVGEHIDAITILVIVILNGMLGFIQEWRAERAMEALQRMLAPVCKVIRDGHAQEINAKELVPGDVVLLEVGDRVPADLRVVEALNLRADESSLTGESVPVSKSIDSVDAKTPLAEQSSLVWMGTAITNGRAQGVVVATGMKTEFGRIAHLTQSVKDEITPLQRKLAKLGKQLGFMGLTVAVLVAALGGLLGDKKLLEMFLTGVSLAVAVVPEGLPAVVTITMALGVRAMVRRNSLMRRLHAAETLGSATVICTDKTGTLTKNEMTIQHIWLPDSQIQVTGAGYAPEGEFQLDDEQVDPAQLPCLNALLETGLRCNHAAIAQDDRGWYAVGDPTEAALVVAARKAGLNNADKPRKFVSEFSFDSRRKRMSVIEEHPEGLIAHVKGALGERGGRSMIPRSAGSTPNATAAIPSVTKLIQSIWAGKRMRGPLRTILIKIATTSARLELSKYRTNFWILSYCRRPSSTALIIVAKLSSRRIVSDAPFATSVPRIPIAIPTSAFLRAGASLTPSPVMATMCPISCI